MHTAAVRRLTGNDHLSPEFATTWSQYDLDSKTRELLTYAKKLTEAPSLLEDADFEALRAVGWEERAIFEATALTAFFAFSGRMEAASGLPRDEVPESARFPEATPDGRGPV